MKATLKEEKGDYYGSSECLLNQLVIVDNDKIDYFFQIPIKY